ncbi:MAG: hypothetical protein JSU81_01890 [Candidatus Coatesbacteria bacterium]|nr:MAG: hypothetical protein JSU81_01890 [Candidatus Coatesbacteria bacterium]
MNGKIIVPALIACAAVGAVCATEYELKWDTGVPGASLVCINVGLGFWWGNDFDVSTLNTRYLDRIKINSSPVLENGQWDGFRIAIWDIRSVPAGIIWPTSGVPRFVKGRGEGYNVWCEFDVGWTLPPGVNTFVAAQEQFFIPPHCDPFIFDDDNVREPHTWFKGPKDPWVNQSLHGHTLMLRVIMKGEVSVEPTSIGRVKALYR